MEGFKKLPKMQCFKEGGYVTSKPKSVVEKTTKVAPTGNKKANAKSAAVAPKEKEDKVDITTMKKGGRAKKAVGTVKKFVKAEAKKASGDKDKTIKVKDTSKKAAAKVKGKEIKKFAVGGIAENFQDPNSPTPYTDPNSPAPYTDPNLTGPSRPYQIDEGFGNGPYPANWQPPGSTPRWGPNLGPNDEPIGTPVNKSGVSGTLSPYPSVPFNGGNNDSGGVGGGSISPMQPPVNGLTISPMQPPVSPTAGYNPNFNPTFTNNNTFNASGDGGYGFGGGSNPMQNPAGQQPTPMPYNQAATPAAPAASSGSVNLLPGLFGANK
jgi:hypothetical protein